MYYIFFSNIFIKVLQNKMANVFLAHNVQENKKKYYTFFL